MSALIGVLCTLGVQKLRKFGKALIIWIGPDTRQISLGYHRVVKGTIPLPEKDILLEGNAKHGGKNSAWIVDPETGWNFIAPTRKETFDKDIKMAVLEPSNPAAYHRALKRHRWNDVLRAGEDNDRWAKMAPMLAIIGLIVVILILATLAWIASKVA